MPYGPDLKLALDRFPAAVVFASKSGDVFSANPAFYDIIPDCKNLSESITGFARIEFNVKVQHPTSSGCLVSLIKTELDSTTDMYVMEDITAEVASKKERFLLADIFEKSSLPALVTDEYERIIRVNHALCEVTGYKVSELIGNKPSLFKSDAHDGYFYYELWQKLIRDGSWQGEMINQSKDGSIIPQLATIHALRDNEGKIQHFFAIYADISEQKKQQERYRFLASHDPLTELPNRSLFQDRLVFEINKAEASGDKVAIIILDLDRFKTINETLKHFGGDLLLMAIADRLQQNTGKDCTLARISGDEFCILVTGDGVAQKAQAVCKQIGQSLKSPFNVKGQEVYITVSSGISVYPDDGEDFTTLLQNAETAMYQSKRGGKNSYNFYNSNMNDSSVENLLLENSLRKSLEENHFYIAYQLQYNRSLNSFCGMEALLRWNHPDLGLIEPGKFIPIAEESGFIEELGDWVIRQIVSDVSTGRIPENVTVSFNVSPRQFSNIDFINQISTTIYSREIASRLELEITESLAMHDASHKRYLLDQLAELGLKIMIDDFGIGYSSLIYLKQFPIHGLKIDRSFVQDLKPDNDSKSIVQAVLSLSESFGISCVAEGVENSEQANILYEMGCNIFQGFYYSIPEPLSEIEKRGLFNGNRNRAGST